MISKSIFISEILNKTLMYEGGYSNNPLDKGGETYRGITKKNFPWWKGWAYVSAAKPSPGQYVLKAEPFVHDFYYATFFEANRFHQLNSVKVATALFDYAVHGGYSVKGLQALLNNKFAANLVDDGKIGPLTIEAINKANESKLITAIMEWRKGYLKAVVKNDPTQKAFENGWNNRLLSLTKTLNVAKENPIKTGLVILAVLSVVGYFVFYHNKQRA
jgi:type VI secretion system secreted protein VgrG